MIYGFEKMMQKFAAQNFVVFEFSAQNFKTSSFDASSDTTCPNRSGLPTSSHSLSPKQCSVRLLNLVLLGETRLHHGLSHKHCDLQGKSVRVVTVYS